MRLHINRQEMQAYITQNVSLQRSPLLRLIPRPLKNWGMATGFRMLGERPYSATFTNPVCSRSRLPCRNTSCAPR